MTNSPYVKAALVQSGLELLPPLIRNSLMDDPNFQEEYGLSVDAVLSFGDSGVSIQRSELLEAIRKLYSEEGDIDVTDKEGQKWDLKINGDELVNSIALCRGEQRMILTNFFGLSSNKDVRINSLNEEVKKVNLSICTRDKWYNILSKRTLSNEELDVFHSEFRETPVEKALSISDEVLNGKSDITSLVPPSRKYFERLVGTYNESNSIGDYAASSARQLFTHLSGWKPYEGFLYSLLISEHSSLTAEIDVAHMESGDLIRAYSYIEEHGDKISQIGAIEVGLRVLLTRPELEAILIRLIEKVRDDDAEEKDSGYQLLSALFILVDGELSRTQLLADTPPFYRRLAAMSQAALIHRQIVTSQVDIGNFCAWAIDVRAQQFYLQSLVDLRTEPRWSPDYSSAFQLKSEFFGRIMIATKNYEKNIKTSELHELVFGTGSQSLISHSIFPYPYLPGPLEGKEYTKNTLPAEMVTAIKDQLNSDKVGPASFIALVNASLIFHIDSDHAKLAAKALKLANYRLSNIEEKSQLVAILEGLAKVSAITRSHELASELRILVRIYRQNAEYALTADEAIRIGLVAAASQSEVKKWAHFVGEWLTELAFDDFKLDEAIALHSHIKYLCHVVPELWITCARADAALQAFINS